MSIYGGKELANAFRTVREYESRGVAAASGMAHVAAASLLVKLDSGKVHIALTNRGIPIDEVNGRVLGALAGS